MLGSVFVEHPLIARESVEDRTYQRALAESCLRSSTLVVLPTGMGKTVIALLVIADVLMAKKGKVLLLAPTKPLVGQPATEEAIGEICAAMKLTKGAVTAEAETSVHNAANS